MARQHSPLQQLKEARQIALDHGLVVVDGKAGQKTTYKVYRKLPERVTYIGRRSDPAALRAFVCACAGFR